jgi:HK97 family phage major capsid protein
MEKLSELRRKLGALTDELNTDAILSDAKAYAAKEAEILEVEATIERMRLAQSRQAALARPANLEANGGFAPSNETEWTPQARAFGLGAPELARSSAANAAAAQFTKALSRARAQLGFKPDDAKHFRSLGEQLVAIQQHAITRGSRHDPRLVHSSGVDDRFTRAPSGASEVDPTGGGFLIQTDFSTAIWMLAHDMGEILGRVNKIPISANSNGLKIPGVDETSRQTGSRWGGVQSYWAAEGTSVTNTKPKFRLIEFDLKKLMSVMYTTDEMLQDSTALTSIAGQAFAEEIMFMTEDAIFEGTGAGQPQGVITCPALVSVAKQNGQATGTIVKENIDNMWARCWSRSRKNAVWFINQDAEPYLNQMNQAVGTGGQLVYLPPGGLSNAPYATLYGRPLVATEYNAAIGTPGDILLADLSQYTLIDKGGVQAATSMHVAFLTDEMVFRITYRVDGRSMWTTAMTPFKGSLTKSPFVALAQR